MSSSQGGAAGRHWYGYCDRDETSSVHAGEARHFWRDSAAQSPAAVAVGSLAPGGGGTGDGPGGGDAVQPRSSSHDRSDARDDITRRYTRQTA